MGDFQCGNCTLGAPCGACKFLRRKCRDGCIFAPYFGTEEGAARFAVVHRVFGASNMSKLLSNAPESYRQEAVATLFYEAQERLSDPVYGCMSTITALEQQVPLFKNIELVASLQAEISKKQTELMNRRFAYTNALQSTAQQQLLQQPNFNVAMQASYSNNSIASTTNLKKMSNFNHSFDLATNIAPSSHNIEPLQHFQLSQCDEDN